jgi:hypothetical protein
VNYFLACSSGRRLRISLPIFDEATLPVIENVAELRSMSDPPKIKMELILDDGCDAWPTIEEQLEGVAFLEVHALIPEALAAELRQVVMNNCRKLLLVKHQRPRGDGTLSKEPNLAH